MAKHYDGYMKVGVRLSRDEITLQGHCVIVELREEGLEWRGLLSGIAHDHYTLINVTGPEGEWTAGSWFIRLDEAADRARLEEWARRQAAAEQMELAAPQRAREKPARQISLEEVEYLYSREHTLQLALDGYGEGERAIFIRPGAKGYELWVPASKREAPSIRWFDGQPLRGKGEGAMRFRLGGQHLVRIEATRDGQGKLHMALPTAPEALEFIVFYDFKGRE